MGNIQTVTAILSGLAVYAALGAVFAAAFLGFGAGRLDPAARNAGVAFRLVVLPGLVALWPLMLMRWIIGGAPHGESD